MVCYCAERSQIGIRDDLFGFAAPLARKQFLEEHNTGFDTPETSCGPVSLCLQEFEIGKDLEEPPNAEDKGEDMARRLKSDANLARKATATASSCCCPTRTYWW